jgi:GT2 family glycosyltransferase
MNPIVNDETYGGLRDENRVVMRHTIALNLDSFKASTDDFVAAPSREYPTLAVAAPPFFSVIIPNYNGQRHLPTVLDALQRQTFCDFEVILADDASGDDSVVLVENRYPAVRLLVNRRNLGFVRTCNAAADAARGRILVLLNNDTEPETTWLEELARIIVAHPRAAAVASKLLLFDRRDVLHSAGDLLGSDGAPINRGVWQKDVGQFDAQQQVFSACGGAAAYRREVWQALGGFDEDLWMYLEDVDFGFRSRLLGFETVFAPQARVYHHLSASGGDLLASYYVGRNSLWLIFKNMPTGLLRRNLSKIVAGQLGVTLDALRNIRGAAARARLLGQIAGLVGLPRQWRKRQVIQAQRQVDDQTIAQQLD